MRTVQSSVCLFRRILVVGFWAALASVLLLCAISARAQDSPSPDAPPQADTTIPPAQPAPVERVQPAADAQQPVPTQPQSAGAVFGGVAQPTGLEVFESHIPADQMAFL